VQQRSIPLFLILLVVLVLAVFSPCVNFHFLRWDDYRHYISNPCVYSLSWYNICNLFQQTINDTYIPLTTLSFNLEYHLFGLSPFKSHLINILLHLAVVLVIFDLALKLKFSPWESFIASAVFALHPMHVESVAWVTERKDVLGILFYVLCLKQYWLYLENNSNKNYGISLLLGFLSVLTKSMAVSIPWVLLLLDWYYQRRWSKKVLLDKLPFAVLIFPVASITFFTLSPHPSFAHNSILIGLWTFSWYLEKFIFPVNLLPAYTPEVPVTLTSLIYLQSLIIFIIFISSMFLWRKNRLFIFACLFWVGTIFIFWRLDFADQNIVADRFMYLPSLGFCLLLGRYLSKFKAIAVLMIIVLGYLTFYQCFIWSNDLTLWSWTLIHDPKNVIAKEGQGVAIYGLRKKIYDYKKLTEAIDKDPSGSQNYLARGEALLREGDHFLAFSDFNKAVRLDPLNFMAHDMRGQLYGERGENKKALDDYTKAIKLEPKNALVYVQMGVYLKALHETDQAMGWFDKAIKIDPSMGAAYFQRGLLFYDMRGFGRSINEFTASILLKNDLKDSYYRRAKSYVAIRRFDKAEEDFKGSLKEDPYDITMLNEFGTFYLMNRNFDKAMEVFNKTISMYPYNAGAYNNRGIVYLQQKQYGLALKDYTTAVSLELYPYHSLITRGDIYFAMGESKKALEDYDLACFFAQGDPLAQKKRDQLKYILSHVRP
jgi:Tfp pilus assembly protein PilF